MTPEKDAQLCTKYPKIFRDRHAPMSETCMCWGLDCGDGWYDLIDVLCSRIQGHVDNKIASQKYALQRGDLKPEDVSSDEDFQVVAAQVKEKFGSLRFYVDGADDDVSGMIAMAEGMSCRICEDCGGKGTLRKGSWWRTMCDLCNESWETRRSVQWLGDPK